VEDQATATRAIGNTAPANMKGVDAEESQASVDEELDQRQCQVREGDQERQRNSEHASEELETNFGGVLQVENDVLKTCKAVNLGEGRGHSIENSSGRNRHESDGDNMREAKERRRRRRIRFPFVDPLTMEEDMVWLTAKVELREEDSLVSEALKTYPEHWFVRFVRGAMYESDVPSRVKLAKKVIARSVHWRRKHGIDRILQRPFPLIRTFRNRICPMRVLGMDDDGHLILVLRISECQLEASIRDFDRADLMEYLAMYQEALVARMRAMGARSTQVLLIDFSGLTWKDFRIAVNHGLAGIFTMWSRHYPFSLHAVYFLHCPVVFKAFFRAIRPWVEPDTLLKINMYSSSSLSKASAKFVRSGVPLERVPTDLGGRGADDLGSYVLSDQFVDDKETQRLAFVPCHFWHYFAKDERELIAFRHSEPHLTRFVYNSDGGDNEKEYDEHTQLKSHEDHKNYTASCNVKPRSFTNATTQSRTFYNSEDSDFDEDGDADDLGIINVDDLDSEGDFDDEIGGDDNDDIEVKNMELYEAMKESKAISRLQFDQRNSSANDLDKDSLPLPPPLQPRHRSRTSEHISTSAEHPTNDNSKQGEPFGDCDGVVHELEEVSLRPSLGDVMSSPRSLSVFGSGRGWSSSFGSIGGTPSSPGYMGSDRSLLHSASRGGELSSALNDTQHQHKEQKPFKRRHSGNIESRPQGMPLYWLGEFRDETWPLRSRTIDLLMWEDLSTTCAFLLSAHALLVALRYVPAIHVLFGSLTYWSFWGTLWTFENIRCRAPTLYLVSSDLSSAWAAVLEDLYGLMCQVIETIDEIMQTSRRDQKSFLHVTVPIAVTFFTLTLVDILFVLHVALIMLFFFPSLLKLVMF